MMYHSINPTDNATTKAKVHNVSTNTTNTEGAGVNTKTKKHIELDGCSLTCKQLYDIGYDTESNICCFLSEESKKAIQEARDIVENIVKTGKIKYGINTGFGNFATVQISDQNLSDLQKNLIRSHACGVGEPLSVERSRMLLALRINVLAKGHSGIRLQTVQKLVDALNKNCISYIPCKGTVGASGDLAPLAHMALGMMGEGKMWNPSTMQYEDASKVLTDHDLTPIDLTAKEGLALINGTQFICSLSVEALIRARNIAMQADIVAALTLETLMGSNKCFDSRIHKARPHKGQQIVAERMRNILQEYPPNISPSEKSILKRTCSEIAESHKGCSRVQDSYTLRCIPQVHGVVHDTIEFVQSILETELNSATDNPMVFKDTKGGDIDDFEDQIVSGGNFHGEYPAKACDYLAIGIQEIANISERRIARLVDQSLSNLPAFLVKQGGLNSGFMIAHCTAAALTSENKVLVHPSSSDTLSTSASKEDHVSMGGFAARKALQIVENVEYVIAVELLCACQALDFIRPLKTTRALEAVHQLVRSAVPHYQKDRYLTPDIEKACEFLRNNNVWEAVEPFISENKKE